MKKLILFLIFVPFLANCQINEGALKKTEAIIEMTDTSYLEVGFTEEGTVFVSNNNYYYEGYNDLMYYFINHEDFHVTNQMLYKINIDTTHEDNYRWQVYWMEVVSAEDKEGEGPWPGSVGNNDIEVFYPVPIEEVLIAIGEFKDSRP